MIEPNDAAAPSAPGALTTSLAWLRERVGQELGVTPWESFDQTALSAYGALTGEDLWIHTDPARAAQSQFGTTLVQASLLIARFGAWIRLCGAWLPEPAVPLNYGYDKIRIPGALPVGTPVRGRVTLTQLIETAGTVRLHLRVQAERPAIEKPVVAAEWIVLFVLP